MKRIYIALISVALFACESVDKPVINLLEVGYENTHTATIGQNLHLEAEMIADGKIDKIQLRIHPEGEEHEHETEHEGWEVDTLYTGAYADVRNTLFHEHIAIPAGAEAGHYHLHIILTDKEGYQATAEAEIELVAPAAAIHQQN